MSNEIKCEYSGIIVEPTHLEFEIEEGSSFVPSAQWLHERKLPPGELPPAWKASVDQPWVKLNPNTGSTPKDIRVNIKSSGMPVGTYKAKITFTASPTVNTPLYVDVTLTVKSINPPPPPPPEPPQPPQPPEPPPEPPEPPPLPTVAITYPIGGETVYEGDTVNITWATSRDTDATLDIYLSVNGTWATIASEIPIKNHNYYWRVDRSQVCEEAIIRIASSSIGNAPQTGPFCIKSSYACPIVNSIIKLFNWTVRRLKK